MEKVSSLLKDRIPTEVKNGITIARVENSDRGFALAKDILYEIVDPQTILYLSGGSQKTLYQMLASEGRFRPGAIALIDERYGMPSHPISNQKLIEGSGLTVYLEQQGIPFYPMLQGGNREETARAYEERVKQLFATFPKHVAILGIGVDGHTAGIAPNRPDLPGGEAGFQNPLFDEAHQELLVGEFHDPKPMSPDGNQAPPNGFGERVTLTAKALAQMDFLLLTGFGENKKQAFEQVFQEGSIEEIPLRFCRDPKIAPKTLFITDQKV